MLEISCTVISITLVLHATDKRIKMILLLFQWGNAFVVCQPGTE